MADEEATTLVDHSVQPDISNCKDCLSSNLATSPSPVYAASTEYDEEPVQSIEVIGSNNDLKPVDIAAKTPSNFTIWRYWWVALLGVALVALISTRSHPHPPQSSMGLSAEESASKNQHSYALQDQVDLLTRQLAALKQRVQAQDRQVLDTRAQVTQLNRHRNEVKVVTAQQLQATETAVLEASAKQLKVLRQDLATETSTFRAQLQRSQASTQEVRVLLERMHAKSEALQAKVKRGVEECLQDLATHTKDANKARTVLQKEFQTTLEAKAVSLEESFGAQIETLQHQMADLTSKPRCETSDRAQGEVSALAQKFAEVESRMRGHLQTRLAKVANHIKSLKEAQLSTQTQLSEGLATEERAEQLRLTRTLRSELEHTQEELQYLTSRTSALERKADQLTTEIATINNAMLEASAVRTSLQHAVDDATASVVQQQRERDDLKQSMSKQCAQDIADHVNQRFGVEVVQADWAQTRMGGRVWTRKTSQALGGTMAKFAISHGSLVPGKCFLFRGSTGQLAVRLAVPIHVSAVTLSHVAPHLKPANVLSSAPKSIEIWGLHDVNGEPADSGVLLREATYDATANAVQTFSVKESDSVRVVELRVLDNHGASNTCVYRLQVHGTPKDGTQMSLSGHH